MEGADAQMVALHSLWQHSVGQSEATIRGRQDALRRLRRTVNVPLLEVTPEQLAAWQSSLTGLAMQSISTYVGHAKGFYLWARRFKHRADDPTVDVLQRPRIPRGVPKPVPDDQLKTALACALPQMRAMLALMAFAGLRCGEVAGLRREDIRDTDETPVITVTGKGGHTRIVPLPEVLLRTLHAYGLPRSGPVFTTSTGGRPFTSNRVSQVVNAHLHRLGIAYSGHKLRHAYGTSVYRMSKDLLLTQNLLGHASPQTTQGYARFSDDAAADLGRMMDGRGRGLLGEDPPPAATPARPKPDPDPLPLAGAAEPPEAEPTPARARGYGHGLRLLQGGAA